MFVLWKFTKLYTHAFCAFSLCIYSTSKKFLNTHFSVGWDIYSMICRLELIPTQCFSLVYTKSKHLGFEELGRISFQNDFHLRRISVSDPIKSLEVRGKYLKIKIWTLHMPTATSKVTQIKNWLLPWRWCIFFLCYIRLLGPTIPRKYTAVLTFIFIFNINAITKRKHLK